MSNSIDTRKDSLFDPIMYLIDREVKRAFARASGGATGDGGNQALKSYIEPIKLIRDSRGRLKSVEGWEHIDIDLNYSSNGLLESVDAKQRLTDKHLKITLVYNERRMLEEVIPDMINAGSGDPGYIDLPNVIPDY